MDFRSDETRLRAHIMSRYIPDIRPVKELSTVTYVNITLANIQVINLVGHPKNHSLSPCLTYRVIQIGRTEPSDCNQRSYCSGRTDKTTLQSSHSFKFIFKKWMDEFLKWDPRVSLSDREKHKDHYNHSYIHSRSLVIKQL